MPSAMMASHGPRTLRISVKSNLPQLEGDRRRRRHFVALTQFTNGVDTYLTCRLTREALDVPVAGHRTQLELAASRCRIDRPGVFWINDGSLCDFIGDRFRLRLMSERILAGLTASMGHPDAGPVSPGGGIRAGRAGNFHN